MARRVTYVEDCDETRDELQTLLDNPFARDVLVPDHACSNSRCWAWMLFDGVWEHAETDDDCDLQ